MGEFRAAPQISIMQNENKSGHEAGNSRKTMNAMGNDLGPAVKWASILFGIGSEIKLGRVLLIARGNSLPDGVGGDRSSLNRNVY